MNREVEERIVAMYFDNENFEKNAKQTINTLGQLKNGLNIEESAKGFGVFEKLGKTLNFDKANQGLQKMKGSISTIGSSFKKMFSIGQAPLREAEGFLQQLNGYVTKYIGFNLAGKIVNSLEGAIRSLTVQPISAGWGQYQSKMDSVKTIMSSTGASLETVNNELDKMTDYANKTIYSLVDMTSNLGKFTNNGVDLERSVKAMEGIANATADAGQGAQQASMAMYNISQAIGVGKMTTIDWKSLENANIATQKLKNTFLEMAAIQGKIEKKTEKDGSIVYMLTKDENGKALKESVKLTAANFREYLSKGWLDKETMLRAFEVYSGTVNENTLESWGIHDSETKKKFIEMGQEALNAATQVRTFSKMMDALSESAQSGWAKSFELIFGNMEQGTTLWTSINEILDGILTKSAEARNEILKVWAGEDQNVDAQTKTLEEKRKQLEELETLEKDLEAGGGAKGFTDQITKTTGEIGKLQEEIKKLQGETDKDGKKVDNSALIKKRQEKVKKLQSQEKELEKKQKEYEKQEAANAKDAEKAKKYEEEIAGYKKDIQELQRSYVKDKEGDIDPELAKQRDKKIAEKNKKLKDAQDKLDKLNAKRGKSELDKTREDIEKLKKEIEDTEKLIDDIQAKPKSTILDEQGRSGRDIAIASLKELIDIFKQLGSTVSEAFGNVFGKLDAQGLFDFTQKISNAIHSVNEWLNETKDGTSRIQKIQKGLQGLFSIIKAIGKIVKVVLNLAKKLLKPVADFFVDIFGGFGDLFDGFGDLDPTQMIIALGDKLKAAWDKIKEFFTPKYIYDDKGNVVDTDIPIITFIKKLWNKVKDIVREWARENGFEEMYLKVSEWWNSLKSSLSEGWVKIVDAWQKVKQWFIDSGISQFFTDAWNWVSSLFKPKFSYVTYDSEGRHEHYENSPFVQFFADLREKIEGAFETLKTWWEEDSGIPAFFRNMWTTVTSLFKPKFAGATYDDKGRHEHYEDSPVVAFFKGLKTGIENAFKELSDWWNGSGIPAFFTSMWNKITGLFKPKFAGATYDDKGRHEHYEDSPVVAFFKGLKTGIENAFKELSDWWNGSGIPDFFTNMWNKITGLFKPKFAGATYDDKGRHEHYEDSPVVAFFKGMWLGIEDAYNNIKKWWEENKIAEFFSGIWEAVTGLFKPKFAGATYDDKGRHEHYEDPPIVKFFTDIWHGVEGAYNGIKKWWEENKVGEWFQGIWDSVYGWFTQSEDGTQSGFAKFLSDIGSGIQEAWRFISEEIPWGEIGKFLTDTWGAIISLFTGEDLPDESSGKTSGTNKILGSERQRAAAGAIADTVNNYNKIQKETDKVKPEKSRQALDVLKEVLTAVGDFFVKIYDAIKGVVISPELQTFMNGAGEFLSGLMKIVGDLLGSFGKWMHGDEMTIQDNQNLIVTGIIAIGAIVVNMLNNRWMSKISGVESFSKKFLEIAGGLFLITTAVAILTTVDSDKMLGAVGAIVVIGGVIAAILGVLNVLNKNKPAGNDPITSSERIINNLIDTVGKVGMVAVGLALLPSIIETVGKVKQAVGGVDIGKDVMESLLGLAGFIATVSIVFTIIQKATGGSGLSPVATAKSALAIVAGLAVVITGFEAVLGLIGGIAEAVGGKDGASNAARIIEEGGEILTAIGKAIGGFFKGIAAAFGFKTEEEKIDSSKETMDALAEYATVLDSEKVTGIARIMGLMAQLTNTADKIDTGKLQAFAGGMESLTTGILMLGKIVEGTSVIEGGTGVWLKGIGTPGSERYAVIEEAIGLISSLFGAFGQLGNTPESSYNAAIKFVNRLAEDEELKKFTTNLCKIVAELKSSGLTEESGLTFDGIAIVGRLYEAIQTGLSSDELPKFDASLIVQHICEAIGLGEAGIAVAVHDLVQKGLELTGNNTEPDGSGEFKFSQENQDFLSELFKNKGDLSGLINMDSLNEQLYGKDGKGGILGAFTSFGEKMPSMEEMIKGTGWMDFTDEKGQPIDLSGNITGELQKLTETLANADPIKVKITPVFDMSNLNADSLRQALADHPVSLPIHVNNGSMQIDFTGLDGELRIGDIINRLVDINDQVRSQADYMVSSINMLGEHMDGIANEVSNLQLVLDTGALVGQLAGPMDQALGDLYNSGRD